MITEIVEENLENAQNFRSFQARVLTSFWVEGGETVLDVANPNGNYSLYMLEGFRTPLANAIEKGRNYECVNPGNSRGRNELGVEFRKMDGLDAGSINELISGLNTSENLYMVVMGMGQILTYGSQKRLKNLEADIDLSDPEQRDRAMLELFSERVTQMNIPYLMLSDGHTESGNINRQAVPDKQLRFLEEELEEKGWKVELFTFNGNFVLTGER